jgi:hypothetical protein
MKHTIKRRLAVIKLMRQYHCTREEAESEFDYQQYCKDNDIEILEEESI